MAGRPRMQRLWMLLLLAAVVAAVFGRGLLRGGAAGLAIPSETVELRDIVVTIEATGVVEPIDLVEVKSKASGQILRMPVEVGSEVDSGDLLAQIDTVDVQNQYEQALASERAAQAKMDISTAQMKRSDDLFDQQIITADEHESAVLDYANSEAQLVRAKTDLDSARQRRADATVRAPIDGTVLSQLVSTGQVISSATSSVSGGTALLSMADLSRIRLRALVSETDIGRVRPGQTAAVAVDAFPEHPFRGDVEKIEPSAVVQQSVTMFPVLISISNREGLLLPGMNGEVTLVVDRRDRVPAVPLDAVRSLRELPAVAAALGMDPDSVQAEVARQLGRRNERGAGGGVDSNGPARERVGRSSMGRGGTGNPGRMGNRVSQAQLVFVETARGLEPRVVRLGLSDFDYVEVVDGVKEGERVGLLGVVELQARREEFQDRIRERMGGGVPGAPAGGGRRGGGR